MRQCNVEDFCIHSHYAEIDDDDFEECSEQLKTYFESWEGYSLICPDMSEIEGGGLLQGSIADMQSKSVSMSMRYCSNETKLEDEPDCDSIEEIHEYVKDLTV